MHLSVRTLVLTATSAFAAHTHAQSLERDPPPCNAEAQERATQGAEQGEPASTYLLARYLSTGQCMAGDGRRAIQLYVRAAELNYPPAFYNLGMLAAARQDFASAEGYLARGALVGHRGSELQLGILYSLVPPPVGSDSKAFAWLSVTAARPESVATEAAERLKVVSAKLSESSRIGAEALAEGLKQQYLSLPAFTP